MNKKQRIKNRATSRQLQREVKAKFAATHVCSNCGAFGLHFIETGRTLASLIAESIGPAIEETEMERAGGFWTCPELYDENGKRKEEHMGRTGDLHKDSRATGG